VLPLDRKEARTCHRCGKKGHLARDCLQRGERAAGQHAAAFSLTANAQAADSQTARAMGAATAMGNSCDGWIVDSGATHHVTGDLGRLTNLRKLYTNITVTFGNGFAAAANQCGNVVIYIKSGTATHSIMLMDVLYVPSATANLISVTRGIDNGVNFAFNATVASSTTRSAAWQRGGGSAAIPQSACLR
jgi:Zinc knuckle